MAIPVAFFVVIVLVAGFTYALFRLVRDEREGERMDRASAEATARRDRRTPDDTDPRDER